MTIIYPGNWPISRPGPITPIQPFTYEDGITYAEILYSLKNWLVTKVIPRIDSLSDEVNKTVVELIAAVDARLAVQDASVDAKILEMQGELDAAIQMIINDSIEVQDPVVAGIFGDIASATRQATDALYAPADLVDAVTTNANQIATVQDEVEAHTLELANQDERIDTINDLTTTGRLSPAAIGATIAAAAVMPLAKTVTGETRLPFVNASDFGVVDGNIGNQAPALTAAIQAAGAGGEVRLAPGGVYRFTEGITIPTWVTLSAASSVSAAGGTAPAELRFDLSTGAAITMENYATLRNVYVRGGGTGVVGVTGIAGKSASLYNVEVANFAIGVHHTDAYYAFHSHCGYNRNGTAIILTNCYNTIIIAPRIYGWGTNDTLGNGINGASRGLTVFGGSIENTRYGVVLNAGQALNMYGTYFENIVPAGKEWPTNGLFHGILARDRARVTVNVQGCMVYMNHMTSFVTTVNSTDVVLTGKGNHFVASEASLTAPAAYEVSQGQAVDLGVDNMAEVAKTGAQYVSVAGGLPVRGGVVTTGGALYDGRARIAPIQSVVHSAAGALTLDVKLWEGMVAGLGANVTALTLSNPKLNQIVSIGFEQDATGGRTYTFPANARFAGGVAPSDTTPNTRTTVRLQYDASADRWREVSRAVAVPK